jgi:hypothetical protein
MHGFQLGPYQKSSLLLIIIDEYSLWIMGLRPAQLLHVLYGVVGVLTIPAAFFLPTAGILGNRWASTGLCSYFFLGLHPGRSQLEDKQGHFSKLPTALAG